MKTLILLIFEMLILIAWGIELFIRGLLWVMTWSAWTHSLERMFFSRIHTWFTDKYKLAKRITEINSKRDAYDKMKDNYHLIFLIPLFLFACNNKDSKFAMKYGVPDSISERYHSETIHKCARDVDPNYNVFIDNIDSHEYIVFESDYGITVEHKKECSGCYGTQWSFSRMRDYQIELDSAYVHLYNGDELVGEWNYIDTKLDSILRKDNQ